MRNKPDKPIVFGELTARQAEDKYLYGDVVTILLPDLPKADFDLPGRTLEERKRFNDFADLWRRAYCGNLLKVDKYDGENWLLYDAGDYSITTDHVHAGEYDLDAISDFICNAPEEVKWLLQLVIDLTDQVGEP